MVVLAGLLVGYFSRNPYLDYICNACAPNNEETNDWPIEHLFKSSSDMWTSIWSSVCVCGWVDWNGVYAIEHFHVYIQLWNSSLYFYDQSPHMFWQAASEICFLVRDRLQYLLAYESTLNRVDPSLAKLVPNSRSWWLGMHGNVHGQNENVLMGNYWARL